MCRGRENAAAIYSEFTEDKRGFYINGEKFAPDAAPMVRAKVGSYQHWSDCQCQWRVHPCTSSSAFPGVRKNDQPIADPVWLDTVNVPYGGSVDVIMTSLTR